MKKVTTEMVITATEPVFEEMRKAGIVMRPLTRVFACVHCSASFGSRQDLDGHLDTAHDFTPDVYTKQEIDSKIGSLWNEVDAVSILTTEYEDLRRAYVAALIELIPDNATVPILDRIERLLFPDIPRK